MLATTLVNMPDVSTFVASTSEWTAPIFSNLAFTVYIALGIVIAFTIITFLISVFFRRK